MNGLEAFQKLREYINIEHRKIVNVDVETIEGYPLDKIERDLKVLQILKEKRVDLRFIAYNKNYFEIKELTLEYNSVLFGNTKLKLTEEEMALIVEWITGVEDDK